MHAITSYKERTEGRQEKKELHRNNDSSIFVYHRRFGHASVVFEPSVFGNDGVAYPEGGRRDAPGSANSRWVGASGGDWSGRLGEETVGVGGVPVGMGAQTGAGKVVRLWHRTARRGHDGTPREVWWC